MGPLTAYFTYPIRKVQKHYR